MGGYSKKPLTCSICKRIHFRWGLFCGSCYNKILIGKSEKYRACLSRYQSERAKKKREKNQKEKICNSCKGTFATGRALQKNCSPCLKKRLLTNEEKKNLIRPCSICEIEFQPVRRYQFICSDKCRDKRCYLIRDILKRRIYNRMREARERCAVGSFTLSEWEEKKKEFNYKCAICGISEIELLKNTFRGLSIDHIVPVSKKGTNYISNLQPLCQNCNSKKSNSIKL